MNQETANIVAFPSQASRAKNAVVAVERTEECHDLLGLLQTTLITDRLVPLFFDLISPHLQLDGYEYNYQRLGIHLNGGRNARYQVKYNLLLEGVSLGEFRSKRKWPYAEHELLKLELFLATLLYPLHNTLLYHQALCDAHTDALTGVGNRASFQGGLLREWKAARRQFSPLSLIAVDVDFFKRVNDTYGHPCGDEVLKTVALCVKESTRGSDLVYRYGGEEFMALLSGTAIDGAMLLAERMRQRMETTACVTEHGDLNVTISVGVATLVAGESETSLLSRADQALYRAKHEGRNRVVQADVPVLS